VYDTVTLPRPVDLRRIAQWSETPIDQIQALNPELPAMDDARQDTGYELKVPGRHGGACQRADGESEPAELASLTFYTVKRGDTLALIAKKMHVSRTDLAEANYLRSTARVVAATP